MSNNGGLIPDPYHLFKLCFPAISYQFISFPPVESQFTRFPVLIFFYIYKKLKELTHKLSIITWLSLINLKEFRIWELYIKSSGKSKLYIGEKSLKNARPK